MLILLSCSPQKEHNNSTNKQYRVIAEKNGKIAGFYFKDNNDTLRIGYPNNEKMIFKILLLMSKRRIR